MKRNKKKIARRGEFWSIRDNKTRGHTAFIVRGNRYRNNILHIPITHHKKTRSKKNQLLSKNPEFGKSDDSYLLLKVQRANEKYLGRKKDNFAIKNTNDKKLVRQIIKNSKRKK